ncbi:hypothetical protein ElyMa_006697000 [Elysia marginata]|uniref:Uncharacterized protein n=1 Tax=Elysia marginata TaxID=1093978 RepID=A0AAV4IUL7_9GAST|nr:hypothetical protein ElyMa_006697000 [Elysia marginata]
MLDIDQIREMCREVRNTTSRADNSLRELMSEMRAFRRQEVELLIKFLAVNRTLLEIKRHKRQSLLKQCVQETHTQCPSEIGQSLEPSIKQFDHLTPHTSSTAENNPNDRAKLSTNAERSTKHRYRETVPREVLKKDQELQDKSSESGPSIGPMGRTREEYIKEARLPQINNNDQYILEHCHTSQFQTATNNRTELDRVSGDVLHSPLSISSQHVVFARRESGYCSSSCSDADIDGKSRGRSCSSSSSCSSYSSSSTLSSLSLTYETRLSSSSNSSQPLLSPPISASLSSLVF